MQAVINGAGLILQYSTQDGVLEAGAGQQVVTLSQAQYQALTTLNADCTWHANGTVTTAARPAETVLPGTGIPVIGAGQLPAPAVQYAGRMVAVIGPPDHLYICGRNAGGAWTWLQLDN